MCLELKSLKFNFFRGQIVQRYSNSLCLNQIADAELSALFDIKSLKFTKFDIEERWFCRDLDGIHINCFDVIERLHGIFQLQKAYLSKHITRDIS